MRFELLLNKISTVMHLIFEYWVDHTKNGNGKDIKKVSKIVPMNHFSQFKNVLMIWNFASEFLRFIEKKKKTQEKAGNKQKKKKK